MAPVPVVSYNGLVQYDLARSPGAFGRDLAPHIFRRFTNLGYTDVQLHNGMGRGQLSGKMMLNYPMYFAFVPIIPGQTRGDVAGFKNRGPSPYNVQDWMQQGPGSQPEHPGGPGQVAGTTILNPMSG
jgi:hypothetical protein